MASNSLVSTPPASTVGADTNPGITTMGPSPTSRQMRLQVSYTFDDASQANCLARWPHLVSTPTVQVDQDLLVGAVELKTCILSIISASPELVATLSQDFCVYAFDFSEPGFPLVGCGMLSWAMLNTQNTTTRIMITGRVRTNKFGVFNDDGVKETLEVKFRLHKVNTFTQEQFVRSVHAYTALSRLLPGNFDASAWSNFVQAHPQVLTMAPPMPTISVPPPQPQVYAPPPPPPPPPQPIQQQHDIGWKDGTASASEDGGQPPKKRQKTTAPKRLPKQTYSKKKSAPAVSSPANTPALPTPYTPEDSTKFGVVETQQSFSQVSSHEGQSFLKPSLSREQSSQRSGLPPSEVSPSAMASSPPTQAESGNGNGILSPAPTSPCLPTLHQSDSTLSKLETLFEEPEGYTREDSGVITQASGNSFSVPTPEDFSVTAAPSPEPSQLARAPKAVMKQIPVQLNDGILTSDLILPTVEPPQPSNIDTRQQETQKPAKPVRTAANVKQRIEMQLLDAIKSGKMPNYCNNCGAIETAVWRRVRPPLPATDKQKEKEISVEPKEEEKQNNETTAVNSKPKERQEPEKEVLLCNACGLWFLSHKTMRPQQLWDTSKQDAPKVPKSRKRKKSAGASVVPTSSTSNGKDQPNDTTETIVLPDDTTPRPIDSAMTLSQNQSISKDDNQEWTKAINDGHRAVQSSPVHGSAASPIDLDAEIDGVKSPRRLLFQTSREPAHGKTPGTPPEVPNKENVPPTKTFEDKDKTPKQESVCPKTPTRERTTRQFRTPLRSASRSISGSASKILMSPCRSSRRGTNDRPPPATPERRILKSQLQRMSLSPTAGLLEKLLADDVTMAEVNNAALNDLLPNFTFDMDDDFMNTDLTMPSSPPQFNLFEDPDGVLSDTITNGDWSDFLPSTPNGFNIEELLEAHKEGQQNGMTVDLSAFIEENYSGMISKVPSQEASPTALPEDLAPLENNAVNTPPTGGDSLIEA